MARHELQITKEGNKYTVINKSNSSFFIESIEDLEIEKVLKVNRKIKSNEIFVIDYSKKLSFQLKGDNCNPYEPTENDYFLYNREGKYLLTITNDGNVLLNNISVDNESISSLEPGNSTTLSINYETLQNEIEFTASTEFDEEIVSNTFSLVTKEATPQNHSLSSNVNTFLLPGQTTVDYTAIINAENSNVDLQITYNFPGNEFVNFTVDKGTIKESVFSINVQAGEMVINRTIMYTDPLCQQYIKEDNEEITFRQGLNINLEILTNNSCSNKIVWTAELKDNNNDVLKTFTTVSDCNTNFENIVLDPLNTYNLCLNNVPEEFESHWLLNGIVIDPEYNDQNICFTFQPSTESLNFNINNKYVPQITLNKITEVNNVELSDYYVLAGQNITWKYTLKNHSIHKDVTIVKIEDDKEGIIDVNQTLEKGQSIIITAGPKLAISGLYENTANAKFIYSENISDTTNSSSSSYFGSDPNMEISLALKKECSNDIYIPNDDEIFLYNRSGIYLITVKNTGNVLLTSINVTNDIDVINIETLSSDESIVLEFSYNTLVNNITFKASTTFLNSEIIAEKNLTTTQATPENLEYNFQVDTLLPPTAQPVIYKAIINNTNVNVDLYITYSSLYFNNTEINAPKSIITNEQLELNNLSAGEIIINRTITYTDPLCQEYIKEDNEEITFRQGSSFFLEVLTNGACSTEIIWNIELFQGNNLLQSSDTSNECSIKFENITLDPSLTYKLVQKNVPTDYASIWRKNDIVLNPVRVEEDLELEFTTSLLLQHLLKDENNLDIDINNKKYSNVLLTFKNFVGISQNNFINSAGALKYRDQVLYTNKDNSNIAIEPLFNVQVVNTDVS